MSKMPGVLIRDLREYKDSRGWLVELFRNDELDEEIYPVMGYISMTHAGVARGPHEHRDQTDGFAFLSGTFRLTLWENRPGLPKLKETYEVGQNNPVYVVVPPGVVHVYENIGTGDATVLNFPNQLYAGKNKSEPVDEIRHEDIDSEFKL